MKKLSPYVKDGVVTSSIMVISFLINLLIQKIYDTQTLIPMIFVLGIFLISIYTKGFFWGIAASLVSVLAVNYAFTFPYYDFDLLSPVCVFSALIMLIVAIMTCTLTARIRAQEQLRRENEKEKIRTNLLRAISHDLRTPLTAIYGSCSAIMENYASLTEAQQMVLLQQSREDAEWLIRMVENLLSVTRIGNPEVNIKKTPLVLEELIDSVLTKFRQKHPEQSVDVVMPEDFISIPMDALLIEQVLINLLENAVIHAKGMSVLSLSVSRQAGEVLFTVSDDGCGIPKERMRELFSGYLKLEDQPDGLRSNMGIGLSVCSAIIKAHSGRIWVKNNKNGGASFYFTLKG